MQQKVDCLGRQHDRLRVQDGFPVTNNIRFLITEKQTKKENICKDVYPMYAKGDLTPSSSGRK